MTTHLFLLVPPGSGSTALWQLLQTSPHVSAFEKEGQWLPGAAEHIGGAERWDPDLTVDWDAVRAAWEQRWDTTSRVRVEKSPPHLVRAQQLEDAFEDTRFVVMCRDPYAYCEGMRRRWQAQRSLTEIAMGWVARVGYQVENQARPSAVHFSYEELTADPRAIANRILAHVPELERLDSEACLEVHGQARPLCNLNAQQTARLSEWDVAEINAVLSWETELIEQLGYPIRSFAALQDAATGSVRDSSRVWG
ncbi:MAG: sulfotransferase [Planctomycetota bacterium]|nr:sulfotransferase [Planctomycetota bacterium]